MRYGLMLQKSGADGLLRMLQNSGTQADLAKQTGVSRWTLYRLRTGRTKRPQAKTVERLRSAGIVPEDLGVSVPGNVHTFAITLDLRYVEVRALLEISLMAVENMSAAELAHILESARRFPDMYGWPKIAANG